jgi:flagellar basal-body rod protein FlgB
MKAMSTRLDALFRFSQDALNLRAYRQQLLASNIANADTPGYQARDIDFSAELKRATAARTQPANGTAPTPPARLGNGPLGAELLYRTAVQPSVDNNTVDLDVERAQFADNAVRYEANLMFVSSQVKSMLAAIQG